MIKVYIQVSAGSTQLRRYNERTLEFRGTVQVSRPYPYPYGFILDTRADDQDNVDCYIITREQLDPGAMIECQPAGLLEQQEGDEMDHKVLAVLPGESLPDAGLLLKELQDFIYSIFADFPAASVHVGPLLPREVALGYILAHRLENR